MILKALWCKLIFIHVCLYFYSIYPSIYLSVYHWSKYTHRINNEYKSKKAYALHKRAFKIINHIEYYK